MLQRPFVQLSWCLGLVVHSSHPRGLRGRSFESELILSNISSGIL